MFAYAVCIYTTMHTMHVGEYTNMYMYITPPFIVFMSLIQVYNIHVYMYIYKYMCD